MSARQRELLDAATRRARERALTAGAQSTAHLAKLLDLLVRDIRARIAQAGPDGRVTAAQIPEIAAWLGNRLRQFSARWRLLLDDGQRSAAKIGASLLAMIGGTGGDAQVVAQVLETIRTFRAADGLVLSDRLWRADRAVRDVLQSAIEAAVARGESSAAAAARYLRDGLPVPADHAAAMAAATPHGIGVQIRRLLLADAAGSPAHILRRLLRTEINRAYTESYIASVAQHPDTIGMRFLLSPAHPQTDICDLWASANLYGLGAGVYPFDAVPYPAHPNTLSYLVAVFADEVTDADRAGREDAFGWLRRQSAATQDLVLGGQRKGAAFRAGLLDPGELRTPWYLIAARLDGEEAAHDPR